MCSETGNQALLFIYNGLELIDCRFWSGPELLLTFCPMFVGVVCCVSKWGDMMGQKIFDTGFVVKGPEAAFPNHCLSSVTGSDVGYVRPSFI